MVDMVDMMTIMVDMVDMMVGMVDMMTIINILEVGKPVDQSLPFLGGFWNDNPLSLLSG